MPTKVYAVGTTLTPTHTGTDDTTVSPYNLLVADGITPTTISSVTVTWQTTSDPGGAWLPLGITGAFAPTPVNCSWSSSIDGQEIGDDYYIRATSGPTPVGLFVADGAQTVTCTPPSDTTLVAENYGLTLTGYIEPGAGTASADMEVVQISVVYAVESATAPPVPDAPTPAITTEVWNAANTAKVTDLSGDWGRSWQDIANDAGTAGLTIDTDTDNDDTDELTVGRHIRYNFGDDLAVTAVIGDGDTERTLAGDGDDAALVTNLRCRGIAAEWDDATVQPVNGLTGRPYADRRPFTWASPEQPITAWNTSYQYLGQISRQINLDPPHHEPWFPPRGWPTMNAEWIWTMNRGNVFPPGRGLMVRDISIGSDGSYTHFIAGDGRVRFFIDGLEAHPWTEQWPVQSFLESYACTVYMTAGTHRLAIEAEVYDDLIPLGRPPRGMATWCVHEDDGSGLYTSSTLVSRAENTGWKAWDVVAEGFTPAPNPYYVLSTFLTEAQADNMLTGWSLSCTASVDSGGQSWARPVEVVPRVGDSGLDLLRMLSDVSIDWRARPAGKVLDVWNKGNRGTTVTGAAITAGTNAYELVRTQ